jgi:hypothetical protein
MEDACPYLAVVYSLCFKSLWGENNSEILTQNNKCVATVSPDSARKLVTNILHHINFWARPHHHYSSAGIR